MRCSQETREVSGKGWIKSAYSSTTLLPIYVFLDDPQGNFRACLAISDTIRVNYHYESRTTNAQALGFSCRRKWDDSVAAHQILTL